MNFLCKLYIPSVNGGMFEDTISGGDSRPDIKQKSLQKSGTILVRREKTTIKPLPYWIF